MSARQPAVDSAFREALAEVREGAGRLAELDVSPQRPLTQKRVESVCKTAGSTAINSVLYDVAAFCGCVQELRFDALMLPLFLGTSLSTQERRRPGSVSRSRSGTVKGRGSCR